MNISNTAQSYIRTANDAYRLYALTIVAPDIGSSQISEQVFHQISISDNL